MRWRFYASEVANLWSFQHTCFVQEHLCLWFGERAKKPTIVFDSLTLGPGDHQHEGHFADQLLKMFLDIGAS